MDKIVIVGSSGHAKVVVDAVEKHNKYSVAGFIDSYRTVGSTTLGIPVLGSEEDLPNIIEKYGIRYVFIAIGDNAVRYKVFNKIKQIVPELPFCSIIHPLASVGKDVIIGEGTVLMAGVVVNSSSVIGDFCILNTNSSLDHDSKMANFSSLAPRVTTGGGCYIGDFSAVGIGATLKHGVMIGDNSVVGANSLVLNNVPSGFVVYGTPAKKVRTRGFGDKYL